MFQSVDAKGLLAATIDFYTQPTVAKNGWTFEGISRLARTDIGGNVLNVCATMTGKRIELHRYALLFGVVPGQVRVAPPGQGIKARITPQ